MASITKEYLRSIVPEDLPDGREILREGVEMGKTIKAGRSRFFKDAGYATVMDYWEDRIKRGEILFSTNVGLATLEEQLAGIETIYKWCKENGFSFHIPTLIPSINVALPPELRDEAADATSYMLNSFEDYRAHEEIEGITCIQANQMLFVPNAIETTVNCIKAGSLFIGATCQLAWDFPSSEDRVTDVCNALRGIGIVASKRQEGFTTTSYPEDGIGGNCVDLVSYVGYLMFERYICEDLCGVALTAVLGGLVSDIRYKAALLKVFHEICKADDHPGVLLQHAATTTQWDHDIETNFGPSMQEVLMMILAERHYKTGGMIVTVPITEALGVPTLHNLETVMGAAARMERVAWQWDDIIDFTKIDEIAEVLMREGRKMFDNIMAALDEAGLDTKDPLQLLMVIKNINAALFEETFHPSVRETGKFTPYFPNDMGQKVLEAVNEKIKDLTVKGYAGTLKGKKILLASLDTHIYGMRYVNNVLSAMGAEVVEGGVDNTPQSVLDIADEEDVMYIGVSTHNGQSLGFAEQLAKLLKANGKEYVVFMGGVLNTILPGHAEPSDVTDMIREKGIFACNDLEETIKVVFQK